MIFDAAILHDPWFWMLGIPAVTLLGLSKGGFMGFGALSLPLLALAVPPVQAAAILLPLLIVQDAVSVWAFRRTWDRKLMWLMLPAEIVGIGLGYLFAASLRQDFMLLALGTLSVLFAGQQIWKARGGRVVAGHKLPDWVGALCGVASGVTSQIAHAGGPPYLFYVVPQRLPRDVMVGTTAILFALVNWIKVPAYVALGQFTPINLLAAAALMPVAIVSTFAGVWLVRRVNAEHFYAIIYGLTVLVGFKLLWDGLSSLL